MTKTLPLTYFVHSTSTDNEAHIRSGWQDTPLAAVGLSQAHALGRQLAGCAFDLVFASDLSRAAETARIAFAGSPIILDARLREMNYGKLNGRQDNAFPDDPFSCIETRFAGGENCLDVEVRMREFLAEAAAQSADKRIAIVAHKYPQLALEVICNRATWQQAIRRDWRQQGAWQPGWQYQFNK